jgi:hypothetical protein
MINFNIVNEDKETMIPIAIEELKTIFDLKLNIVSIFDMDFNDFNLMLENHGIIDNEDAAELPLMALGLGI